MSKVMGAEGLLRHWLAMYEADRVEGMAWASVQFGNRYPQGVEVAQDDCRRPITVLTLPRASHRSGWLYHYAWDYNSLYDEWEPDLTGFVETRSHADEIARLVKSYLESL